MAQVSLPLLAPRDEHEGGHDEHKSTYSCGKQLYLSRYSCTHLLMSKWLKLKKISAKVQTYTSTRIGHEAKSTQPPISHPSTYTQVLEKDVPFGTFPSPVPAPGTPRNTYILGACLSALYPRRG
eukprot:5109890-Amphidinium_carterae.1